MGEFSGQVISLFNLSKRAAKEQGGLLSGKDPSGYNKDDPIRLWIIQVGIIIGMASFLGLLLKRIRQPKVIAEVLGGIILGPTAFGRIPGFTEHVFPEESRSYLNLVANIGLCLFLFLVGLEIEGAIIKRNARLSMMIALAGMVIPFALGVGMAVPIYKHFVDDSIKFTHFMLFVGVAFSITAFPVLCRILTELKLLDTTVGIVVLSAGVANDIIGWVLLALTVALVNAGSGLMALYILLCCVGWTLFLLFPVRWGLHWLAVKTGSIETGPTTVFMTITILIVFGSAFFTDIIGVHAIFGAFVAGLIVPREGHLNITLTEKLEDMVSIIFLPLYFTLSGLSTDLGLLNNGMTWGYTIAICVVAFTAKFGGCSLAARFAAGFNWREASTIGSLMSCKGLIELIVLNVGLSAHILSQRVFSMFVLEALVLTFMTTPLCTTFYPPQFRVRATAVGGVFGAVTDPEDNKPKRSQDFHKRSFTVVLDKLEHVPSMMAMTQLIRAPPNVIADDKSSGTKAAERSRVSVEALRLIELSDRTSAVMKSWAAETILQTDPILGIFKMFGLLNDLPITPALAIVPYDELSHSVAEHARAWGSDMIIVPWLPPHPTAPFHAEEQHPKAVSDAATPSARSNNPFDMIWKGQSSAGGNTGSSSDTTSASAIHSQFVRGVFVQATVDVALFVDQTGVLMPNSQASDMQHLFLPFFGGPDDRLALDFVAQCCENPRITATVVKILKVDAPDGEEDKEVTEHFTVASAANGIPDTVYGAASTETRLQSDTADNIIWAKYTTPVTTGPQTIPTSTLDRMSFHELSSPTPLHTAVVQAHATESHGARKLVVVGRSRRMAVESHTKELRELISEKGKTHVAGEVMKTIGDVGTAFVVSGSESGIVVIQAAATREG